MIGPKEILVILAVYLALTIISVLLVFKKEKDLVIFIWLAVVFMVPFLGPVLYITKYLIERQKIES